MVMATANIMMHETRDDSGVLYRHFTIDIPYADTADEATNLAQALVDSLRGDRKAYLRRKVQAISSQAAYLADVTEQYWKGYARFSICPEIAGDWTIEAPSPSDLKSLLLPTAGEDDARRRSD
jgi:hypothetical protein